MSTLIQHYRETEAKIAELRARIEQLRPEVEDRLALVDLVVSEAQKNGFDLKEIALAIYPALGKASGVAASAEQAPRKTRKARRVKVYINPHNQERIETKGGNHAGLKDWKRTWGISVVESWLQPEA